MKLNKQLKALRISNQDYLMIEKALNDLNKKSNSIQIRLSDFRRWALRYFVMQLKTGELVLNLSPLGATSIINIPTKLKHG